MEGIVDICSYAEAQVKAEQADSAAVDSYVLVLGSKQGGKSTLVNAFLNPSKEDTPKPTLGLDYSFGRRAGPGSVTLSTGPAVPSATGAAASSDSGAAAAKFLHPGALGGGAQREKDVCHVWELGGNSLAYAELTSIVLTPQRLPSNVIVLVLDLSRPGDSLATGARWLGALRARLQDIVDRMGKAGGKKGGSTAAAAAPAAPSAGATFASLAGDAAVEHLRGMSTLRRRVGWAQRSGSSLQVALPEGGGAGGTAKSSGSSAAAGPSASSRAGEGADASAADSDAAAAPQARSLSDLRAPAVAPASLAALLASIPEHPDVRTVGSTALPCQLLVVGHKYDAIREADSVRKKAITSALRYLAHCHGGAVVTTSARDKSSLASYRALLGAAAFGTEARRGAQADPGRPLYIPAGADSLESIGLPITVTGAAASSRADIENAGAAFEGRFERFMTSVRHYYPPSAASGGPGAEWEEVDAASVLPAPSTMAPGASLTFADEASRHPEPVIDSLRVQKAEEAARYAREAERRLRLEAKAAASAPSGGAAGSGGPG